MPVPVDTPVDGPTNPIIKAAVAHYGRTLPRMIPVPEWGPGEGVPARVYCYPMSVEEKADLMDAQRDSGLLRAGVDLIIRKAMDENNKPMFTVADKIHLLRAVSPAVTEALAARIMGTQYGAAADLLKK